MSNFFYLAIQEQPDIPQAIIERSREPFVFSDGRFKLLFEGVIFPKGKKSIDDPEKYVSTLFIAYGTHAFSMLRGHYSFVIWDEKEQVLYGVRDRFGMYPMYYREGLTEFKVATNKKSLISEMGAHTPSEEALQHYFSFQYSPEPLTMSEGVYALEAGHYFEKKLHEPIKVSRYFHAAFSANGEADEQEVIEDIQHTLTSAVTSRLSEQGSVGVFLSGGIDSSVIAALAKKYEPSVQAFSVGFAEEGYSEVAYARRTAEELGIKLITHTITAEEFMDVVPRVVSIMEDPIADPSCIPLYVAAREAKKHVDVILSGEGADELFGGYGIYREYESLKFLSQLPDPILRSIRFLAEKIPEGFKGKSFLMRATTPLKQRYIGNAKIFEESAKRDFLYLYDQQLTYEQKTMSLYEQVEGAHPTEQMQYVDLHTWLPGNILAKARTMANAHGLDVRMPFLDVDVFAIAKEIPVELKIRNQTTKYVLREAAKGIAPAHVIDQKKLGFPVPIRQWLKDELYDWAVDIIHRAQTSHVIDHEYALDLVRKHATGRIDYSRKIWTILIFMIWYEAQIKQVEEVQEVVVEEKVLYGT